MHLPPEDSWHLAYFIFFLQGIGQLFPWNTIINAEEYFRRRFCGTSFETSFENSFALSYNTSAIVGIVITLRYFDDRNLRFRVMGSLAVSTLAFGAYGVIVLMENMNTALLFFFTLGSIFASGLAVAFSQAGLFSMASAFPPKYTQAMMAGQGLAGLVVALSGLFTTLTGPDDQSCIPNDHAIAGRAMNVSETPCAAYTRDWSTLAYFSIAVAVLLGCLVTFPVLQRLPVVAFYTRAIIDSDDSVNGDDDDVTENGINDVVSNGDIEDEDSSNGYSWFSISSLGVRSNVRPRSMHRRLVEAAPKRLLPGGEALSDSVVHQKPQEEGVVGGDVGASDSSLYVGVTGLNGLRSKLAPISLYGFALFFTFSVTLAVFPGATSLIVSSRQCQPGRSRFFAPDVFVMFSFVSFNAFDFLGRLASGLSIVLPARWLPFAALLRLVFVPLLLACRSEHSRFSFRWLWDDVFPLSIMPMFAFTNGYVGSLSVMAGSQKGPWASTAMMLFLSTGLFAGSMLSFLVLYASTKS